MIARFKVRFKIACHLLRMPNARENRRLGLKARSRSEFPAPAGTAGPPSRNERVRKRAVPLPFEGVLMWANLSKYDIIYIKYN